VKYGPLRDYLWALPKSTTDVSLRFSEIERIIQAKLPKSASEYGAWWGNQDHGVQAPAWIGAGFVVDGVDFGRKLVRFQRGDRTTKPRIAKKQPRTKTRIDLPVGELIEAGFHLCGHWELLPAGGIRFAGEIPKEAGVYAYALDGMIVYIGVATIGLKKRVYFYGKPGPSQPTNLRINDLISKALAKKREVELLVVVPGTTEWNGLPVDLASGLEHGLIKKYLPPWNKKGAAG
jgi:hypothetical protein